MTRLLRGVLELGLIGLIIAVGANGTYSSSPVPGSEAPICCADGQCGVPAVAAAGVSTGIPTPAPPRDAAACHADTATICVTVEAECYR